MVHHFVKRLLIKLIELIEIFTTSSQWKLKSAIICAAFSLISSFPDYDVLLFNNSNPLYKSLQEGLQFQLEDPFKPIPQQYLHLANEHLDKRAFRITVPIIASLFNLNLVGCILLQHLTGVLLFYLIIVLCERFTEDKVVAFLVSIGIASTFVGNWSFYDSFYFDGIAYFLLILSMVSTNAWLVGAGVFLAAFTDERALIASSLIIIWWTIQPNKNILNSSMVYVNTKMIAVLLSWLLYFITRYVLSSIFGLSTGSGGINWSTLRENYRLLPYGILSPIEAFWWVIIAGLILLIWQRRYILFLMLSASVCIVSTISFIVNDISRSMGYILPAVIISIYILSKSESKHILRIAMLLTSIVCVIFPNTYVMMDIYWMSPIVPKIIKWFSLAEESLPNNY